MIYETVRLVRGADIRQAIRSPAQNVRRVMPMSARRRPGIIRNISLCQRYVDSYRLRFLAITAR